MNEYIKSEKNKVMGDVILSAKKYCIYLSNQ